MKRTSFLLLIWAVSADFALSQGVFVKKLRVQSESAFDWQYAVDQSVFRLGPDDRIKKYEPRRQLYDFFGPRRAPMRALPLILFVSPGNSPLEWKQFAATCQKHGVLFAGVRKAGNGQSPAVRVRAALDVLGDVRRRYRVDPDRTYSAGFSGGATIAAQLAFSLPECFGGLMCIGQRVLLPRADIMVRRSSERISIAALCGGNELVGPEVEHIDQPTCSALGFRCRVFVSRGAGHRMPKPAAISTAYRWLEGAARQRKSLAERYESTRLDREVYDEVAWQESLLDEADQRRKAGEHEVAAELLSWLEERWPDSPTTVIARDSLKQLAQTTEFSEQAGKFTEERETKVNKALILGYEKLAKDRRAWFTSQRRADYAARAIRLIEQTSLELDDKLGRLEALKEVFQKAK